MLGGSGICKTKPVLPVTRQTFKAFDKLAKLWTGYQNGFPTQVHKSMHSCMGKRLDGWNSIPAQIPVEMASPPSMIIVRAKMRIKISKYLIIFIHVSTAHFTI